MAAIYNPFGPSKAIKKSYFFEGVLEKLPLLQLTCIAGIRELKYLGDNGQKLFYCFGVTFDQFPNPEKKNWVTIFLRILMVFNGSTLVGNLHSN